MKTSKLVFKPVEIKELGKAVQIEAPKPIVIQKEDEEAEKIKSLQSQREEMEKRLDEMRAEANSEAQEILENAKMEAEKIINDAENGAFERMKKATENAKSEENAAKDKGEKAIILKQNEAQKVFQEAQEKAEEIRASASKEGYDNGYNDGYNKGKAEVDRLIARLGKIIEGAIDKREMIIQDAEEQVVRIILLIARKVVKAISREQEGIVIENIKSALEKIQGKEEVIIRVNAQDLEMTTEHRDEFLSMLEDLKHVTVLEDSRVEKGGCMIETDFGSVDARISTQLEEMEDKIRDLAQFSYFEPVRKKVDLKKELSVADEEHV